MNASTIMKILLAPIAAGTTALVLSSCGLSPSVDPATTTSSASTSTGSVTATSSPWPSISSSASPTASNTLAPIETSFTISGTYPSPGPSPTFSFTVNTDNLLQVTITAGPAAPVISGSNFSAEYDCVSYKLTVAGDTVYTNYLSVNGGDSYCSSNGASQMIDFSSYLSTGHGPVSIAVATQNYDFYFLDCLNEYYNYGYYSPYQCFVSEWETHPVFSNHGVTGTLSVAINGTE